MRALGHPASTECPGVYAVAMTAYTEEVRGALAEPPLDLVVLQQLLRDRPVTIDGEPATLDRLCERLAEWWLADETVLYVGLARASVADRVGAHYRTKLGARSPHAGG